MTKPKKKGIFDYLDSLVDKEGIKTDLKITLTNQSLWKAVAGLIFAGVCITVVAHLIKNAFPNKQLTTNNQHLVDLKNTLSGKQGVKLTQPYTKI